MKMSMNISTHKEQPGFIPSLNVSHLVNEQMQQDSFYHPNLGGVTKGGMSNHFPMTVMALAGLGASDNEINQFRMVGGRHRAHVDLDLGLVDREEVTLDNWTNFLGQSEKLLELRRVFTQGLKLKGAETFITECLGKMMLSLPMGLFHPLINLSFAVVHGDTKLISNALAYFAIRYYNLFEKYPQIEPNNKPENKLKNEQNSETLNSTLSVWQSMSQNKDEIEQSFQTYGGSLRVCEQLCAENSIQQLSFSNQFDINQDNLSEKIIEISQAAIRLYLHHPALTTLHAVTSCQALADMTGRLGQTEEQKKTYVKLWTLYWVWLTGLYLEKGSPEDLPMPDSNKIKENVDLFNEYSWEVMAEKARKIPEAHLVKMVYSCKWLYENIEDNPLYQLACMNILVEKRAHPYQIRWSKLGRLV